jgi:hypothetical protein
MPIANDEDLKRLAQLVRDGKVPEESREQVMGEIRKYSESRQQRLAEAEQEQTAYDQHDPDQPWYRHGRPGVKEVGDLSAIDYAEGLYELAMMSATGIVAQPLSGLGGAAAGGLAKLAGSKEAVNAAEATRGWLEGMLTNDPEGEAMKTFASVVGPTAEMIDRKIDDSIWAGAEGNPELAAAGKTLLYGLPSVVGLGRMNVPKRIKIDLEQHRTKKRIAAETEAEGFTLESEKLPGMVRSKSHELVPDENVGSGWDEILDEVRAAEKVERTGVDEAYDAARATQAFAEIKPLRLMAKDIRREFEGRFNVKRMPQLNDHITDLRKLASQISNTGKRLPPGKRRTAVEYNELELLRQRISNDITGKPGMGNFTPQDKALLNLRDRLDTTIDDLWRRGAVSGDAHAIETWRNARALSLGHNKRFNADRTVRRMLMEDTTPEGAYRLVIGASAMGAKPQAVATIRRLKEILGPDHPALVNVRKAMIRDTLMPALGDKANYGKLATNIDKLLKNNYSLVQEAGVDVETLRRLRRAAHVANETVKLNPEKFQAEYVTGVIASVAFGHGIARKGAVVRTVRKLLNRTLGVGLMSKSDIKRHLLDAEYDKPMRSYSGPELPWWLAMTSASDLSQDNPDQEMAPPTDEEEMY